MTRLRQLGKDSIVYGIGRMVSQGIGLFLLPVYTRIFSPGEYGTVETMMLLIKLLSAVLVMGMDSAQSFYFFQQKANGIAAQKQVVTSILQWRLTWGVLIVSAACLAAPLMNRQLFAGTVPWPYFAVSFVGALLLTAFGQSIEVFRLLYRPWAYMGMTLAHSVLTAGSIVTLVIGFRLGVAGYFIGTAAAAFVACLFGWWLIRDYVDLTGWHRSWWPRLLKFGAPLLPAGVAFYVLSTADRWFVQHYAGQDALGVYAVGARFALVMAIGVEVFRKAWWPMAMDAMHSEDGPETFRMIAQLFMGLGVAAVVYLTLLAPWLVRRFSGPSFHDAHPLVGVLAWQGLFYGFFAIASAGLWKAEKSFITLVPMIAAAALNVGLNVYAVPTYGAMGAALSAAVSYFFWIAIVMTISERFWRVGFPIVILLAQIAAGAVTVAVLISGGLTLVQKALLAHVVCAVLVATAFERAAWRQVLGKLRRMASSAR